MRLTSTNRRGRSWYRAKPVRFARNVCVAVHAAREIAPVRGWHNAPRGGFKIEHVERRRGRSKVGTLREGFAHCQGSG